MYKSLFILLIILSLTGCGTLTGNVINDNKSTALMSIDKNSHLSDFYNKPSIILFGATYCGHCQAAMPLFKEQVYDVYKEDLNIWVNVVDKGTFPVEEVPQGYNENLDFDEITGKECDYVPSWVLLEKGGEVVMSSCGGEKEMAEMLQGIKEEVEE